MMNYITDSYPNVEASALAALLIPSSVIAAGMAHLGAVMFNSLSMTYVTTTLGFICITLSGLIYIVFFFGARIRRFSKLARTY
jgi:hypothetical protein